MYDTSGSYSVCYAAPQDDGNVARRLCWLKGELTRQAATPPAANAEEERRALRSVTLGPTLTAGEAYAWFGTFLGLFPPFAIFARMFGDAIATRMAGQQNSGGFLFWAMLFLLVNAVCCLVGRWFGAVLGRRFGDPRGSGWPTFLLTAVLMGIVWGLVTGAAGGAVVFLLGAFFGMACAVPVALAAFPAFAVLHRLHARDGMIEERRVWPLAFGVPLTIAALILSPWFN